MRGVLSIVPERAPISIFPPNGEEVSSLPSTLNCYQRRRVVYIGRLSLYASGWCHTQGNVELMEVPS